MAGGANKRNAAPKSSDASRSPQVTGGSVKPNSNEKPCTSKADDAGRIANALGPIRFYELGVLMICVGCVFSRCWDADRQFDNGDDRANYPENTLLRPAEASFDAWLARAREIWNSEPIIGVWEPCALLLKAALANAFGNRAQTILAAGAVLHCFACGLVASLTLRLMKLLAECPASGKEANGKSSPYSRIGPRCCVLAALITGIHPLRVESLGWASCLPFHLASIFSCFACICHVQHRSAGSAFGCKADRGWPMTLGPWRCCSAIFFYLACLSKPAVLGVLGALGLLDLLLLLEGSGSLCRFLKRALVVFLDDLALLIAGGAGFLSALQASSGKFEWFQLWDMERRLLRACHMVALYALQQVWPKDLCMFYAHPVDEVVWANWRFGGAVIAVVVGLTAAVLMGRRCFIAALTYLALLSPSLGIVGNHIAEMAADRYCHVASLLLGTPILAFAFASLAVRAEQLSQKKRQAFWGIVVVVLPVCLALEVRATRGYMEIWLKQEKVVEHAVMVAPRYYRTRYILADQLKREHRTAEAEHHFRKSFELWPGFVDSHFGLAEQLMALGRRQEAVSAMRHAVVADPKNHFAHGNVGRMLFSEPGKAAEAACSFKRAIHYGEDSGRELHALIQRSPEVARACDEEIFTEATRRQWQDGGEVMSSNKEGLISAWRMRQALHRLWFAAVRDNPWRGAVTQGPEEEAADQWPAPYLSIVVTSRNDNYGGGQAARFVSHVSLMVHQLMVRNCSPETELLYVEWNPPADKDRLLALVKKGVKRGRKDLPASYTCPRSALRIRMISAPASLHERLQAQGHLSKAPMAEYYGKNLGIRAARGEYVLASNFDAVLSPALMDFLQRKQLRDDSFYVAALRFSTEDPKDTLKTPVGKAAPRLVQQAMDVERIKRTEYWDTRFHRPEFLPEATAAFGDICLGTDKGIRLGGDQYWDYQAGDFVLARREHFQKVRAYPETEFTFGIDSSILCKLVGLGLRQVVFLPPCLIVHQHHQIRVNPNARKLVDSDWLCARVREDPAAAALHSTQRDPEMWGIHDVGNVSYQDLLKPVEASGSVDA